MPFPWVADSQVSRIFQILLAVHWLPPWMIDLVQSVSRASLNSLVLLYGIAWHSGYYQSMPQLLHQGRIRWQYCWYQMMLWMGSLFPLVCWVDCFSTKQDIPSEDIQHSRWNAPNLHSLHEWVPVGECQEEAKKEIKLNIWVRNQTAITPLRAWTHSNIEARTFDKLAVECIIIDWIQKHQR